MVARFDLPPFSFELFASTNAEAKYSVSHAYVLRNIEVLALEDEKPLSACHSKRALLLQFPRCITPTVMSIRHGSIVIRLCHVSWDYTLPF